MSINLNLARFSRVNHSFISIGIDVYDDKKEDWIPVKFTTKIDEFGDFGIASADNVSTLFLLLVSLQPILMLTGEFDVLGLPVIGAVTDKKSCLEVVNILEKLYKIDSERQNRVSLTGFFKKILSSGSDLRNLLTKIQLFIQILNQTIAKYRSYSYIIFAIVFDDDKRNCDRYCKYLDSVLKQMNKICSNTRQIFKTFSRQSVSTILKAQEQLSKKSVLTGILDLYRLGGYSETNEFLGEIDMTRENILNVEIVKKY